ncbi:hypothetical protein Bhyg_07623 [Pseudolycoriella hygida]|uniref:Uncharacterized protein n=1 Tax=Pseudolycoriella hygida TaxID=35572 RepID=A0A9Q0S405_9DIPT|nr:hypothetical protein Bhyg_07623 [Pseudolycoriella hygida]
MCDLDKFWNVIEVKMGCNVPKHIQNILALNGYENAVSIKTITSEDMRSIQIFAQTTMKDRIPEDSNLEDYYGSFGLTPDKFAFLPGYIKLIEEIVSFIKRASRTVMHTTKTSSSTSIALNRMTSATSNPSTSIALNPTTSASLIPTTSFAVVPREADQVDLQSASADESIQLEILSIHPDLQIQRKQIHSNVISWTRKHARGIYEQYSKRFNIDMVTFATKKNAMNHEIVGSEETIESGRELFAAVRCPICLLLLAIYKTMQKLVDGREEGRVAKRRPQRRSKCVEDLEQELTYDSDGNSDIEKEMQNNFERDSTDFGTLSESEESLSSQQINDTPSAIPMHQREIKKTDNLCEKNDDLDITSETILNHLRKTVDKLMKENKMLRDAVDELTKENEILRKDAKGQTISFCNKQFDTNDHLMLRTMINAANKNVLLDKHGYRHEEVMKAFAAYMKIISGPLAYETLHANLSLAWPSTSTANKFIYDNGSTVLEGKLRYEELYKYLRDRDLPLRVSLSEDATRIQATVYYDPKTNQLVGFSLPLDENGLPITYSYMANNTTNCNIYAGRSTHWHEM